jgi:hypothetical protein
MPMQQRWISRWLASSLVSLALLAGGARAQQKYRLRQMEQAGDFSQVEGEMDMTLDMRVTAGDQVVPGLKFTNRELEKYTEEILSVDRQGASGLRRVYSVARSTETDPSGAAKQQVSSLQGKTVGIRRRSGKVVVTSTPGSLSPEDRKSLLDDLDNDAAAFFPNRNVGPGDEWAVDPKMARRIFDDVESASIRCRFEEVTRYSGRECARIRMAIDLKGQPEGMPGQLTMKLAGDGYYALDLERPIALDLGGTITMQGKSKENGVDVIYTGDGTFRAKESVQWVKIAGKPVAREP